jgi:hypothetical protein
MAWATSSASAGTYRTTPETTNGRPQREVVKEVLSEADQVLDDSTSGVEVEA